MENNSETSPWVVISDEGEAIPCDSEQEAVKLAESFMHVDDDGFWNEDGMGTIKVCKIIYKAIQTDVERKPSEEEIDEDGHDENGQYWGIYSFLCNYKLAKVAIG